MKIQNVIRKFKAGNLSKEDLVKALADRHYRIPDRQKEGPIDKFEREAWLEAEANYSQDETWDEVRRARNVGDLTPTIYREIQVRHLDWLASRGVRPGSLLPPPLLP